ncbi:MAG: SDR family oxidoreductase [Chitinophagaceae bacterium]
MKILVTGGAGFIGSNLVATLLNSDKVSHVRVLDNFATSSPDNISEFGSNSKFSFVKGDIRNYSDCLTACDNIDHISHQAALGSVPRSVADPLTTNDVNIAGTLNIFNAAKEQGVKRIVYASSSSVYGDNPALPKKEENTGNPLSPYAVTKYVNELYAQVYSAVYGMQMIGLRYFNVFGPRQNPEGPYAAVIPLFIEALLGGKQPVINGDGNISRDFTYVDNAVQANILSLFTENKEALNEEYNIACGEKTTLFELFNYLREASQSDIQPILGADRTGDIKHSLADISKAKKLLNYDPSVTVKQGLEKTFNWYKRTVIKARS